MDEYIDRGTAIAKLTALDVSEPNATMVGAKRLLAEIPAADVAPVTHGEWIEDDYGYNRCSACGWEWDEPESVTPYCPHCGAKMEEGEIDA
nr:MAG TPA: hypothetical protein [Caudoviricetes sp.]